MENIETVDFICVDILFNSMYVPFTGASFNLLLDRLNCRIAFSLCNKQPIEHEGCEGCKPFVDDSDSIFSACITPFIPMSREEYKKPAFLERHNCCGLHMHSPSLKGSGGYSEKSWFVIIFITLNG